MTIEDETKIREIVREAMAAAVEAMGARLGEQFEELAGQVSLVLGKIDAVAGDVKTLRVQAAELSRDFTKDRLESAERRLVRKGERS